MLNCLNNGINQEILLKAKNDVYIFEIPGTTSFPSPEFMISFLQILPTSDLGSKGTFTSIEVLQIRLENKSFIKKK